MVSYTVVVPVTGLFRPKKYESPFCSVKPTATMGLQPIRCASCTAKHRLLAPGWNGSLSRFGIRAGDSAHRIEPSLLRPRQLTGSTEMPAMRRSLRPIIRALRACAVE